MRKRALGSVVLAALIGTVAPVGPAAAGEGALEGRATLPDGSRLSGASVTVTSVDELPIDLTRRARTNEYGEFRLRFLPAGNYRVVLEGEGLQTVTRQVEVRAGQITTVSAELPMTQTEVEVALRGQPGGAGARSAGGQLRAEAFRRPRADGTTSLGVGLEGRPFDQVKIGLPITKSGSYDPTLDFASWAFDPKTNTASGPATDSLKVRLDVRDARLIPEKLKIDASLDGKPVHSERVAVGERPAVDPTNVPYMGLPDVVAPRDPIFVTSPEELEAAIEMLYQTPSVPEPPRQAPRETSQGVRSGPGLRFASEGELPPGTLLFPVPLDLSSGTVVQVMGTDAYGETIFEYKWTPLVLPEGLCAGGPLITGGSDLNFAGQQLCVCGCFDGLTPAELGGLQIGGRPLGPPRGLSPYVANFVTPGDLAPGPYQVGWAPGAGGSGAPFTTEVIEIRARINDELIQRGGSTGLEMDIVGTERKLAVELENKSPGKISMKPADSVKTQTTGGPGRNHVPGIVVTGKTPGRYTIDWKLDAGTCPCAQTLPKVAEARDAKLGPIMGQVWDHALGRAGAPSWPAPGAPCTGPLDLAGGRFQAEVIWTGPEAQGGLGPCTGLSSGGALFTPPGADRWGSLLEIIDGCDVNRRYWVFFSSLTNVELTLTVTDTESGERRSYANPVGNPAPAVTDTMAFATCP